jgi:hypothetical protein
MTGEWIHGIIHDDLWIFMGIHGIVHDLIHDE